MFIGRPVCSDGRCPSLADLSPPGNFDSLLYYIDILQNTNTSVIGGNDKRRKLS